MKVKEISIYLELKKGVKIFKNGFQSWSPSYEIDYKKRVRKPPFFFLKINYLDPKGESGKESHFFTYIKDKENYTFIFPENFKFPVKFTPLKDKLKITFEIEREVDIGSIPKLKISTHLSRESRKKIYGWTSWYSYYRNIDPDKIVRNIDQVNNIPIKLNYFQIDDGWEESVGDWFENERFKGFLKGIVDKIKDKGLEAGIWMAPFIVERNSRIFREHRDWIVKDKRGRLKIAGFNPLWSGFFFPLDITKDEVKDYILQRINYLKDIGFTLFKFDFLYSLLIPNELANISRMELFFEGMKNLRRGVGEGKILGCGAPFIPMKGLYDILRVGPDTKDGWRDYFLSIIGYEGEVSAMNSLRNTLSRSFVPSNFFLKDPDVIFLKPKKLNKFERDTIIISNFLLSDVIFFSDPLYLLNRDDFLLLLKLKKYEDFVLKDFLWEDSLFKFKGSSKAGKVVGFVNLGNRKRWIDKRGLNEILYKKNREFLYPHETRVFIEK